MNRICGLAVGILMALQCTPPSLAADIDFEGFDEGTAIAVQYQAALGVTFSLVDNATDLPVIAVEGCPIFAYDAGAGCDTPREVHTGVACLADPRVSGTPQRDYAVGQSIAIDFDPPIRQFRMTIYDIDHDDAVDVALLDGLEQVGLLQITFQTPHTSNATGTTIALAADTITRVELRVPAVIGWAVDDIYLSRNPCPGDTNVDRSVDLNDLATLLARFGLNSGATLGDGDLDQDGDVDLVDLARLLVNFGSTCSE